MSKTQDIRTPKRPPRIKDGLPPRGELRPARAALAKQLRYRDLGLLGHAIILRAIEYLPNLYNPAAKGALEHIARALEFAFEELGFSIQKGVVRGVTPEIGSGAASSDFFGAGCGIIGTIVAFTDSLAELLVRTIEFGQDADTKWISINEDAYLERLREDEQLRSAWERFFLRGAGLFFNGDEGATALTKRQATTKYQLTSAMEVFVLGHEYGYHISRYAPPNMGSSAPFYHELRADQIALQIGDFLGARCFAGTVTQVRNTWMESGAGAVAVVRAAQVVRCVRKILETGIHDENDRLVGRMSGTDRLYSLEYLAQHRFERLGEPFSVQFRCQRSFLGRLLPGVFNLLKMRFWAAHKAGYRPISIASMRDSILAERKEGDALVEIVTDDVAYPQERTFTSNNSVLKKHISAGNADDGIVIAREYVRHYQEKSVRQFAESVVQTRIGTVEPELITSVTERLRVGRTTVAHHGFQEVLDLYSYMIEQVCLELRLPIRGGIVCGVAWDPAAGPVQRSISERESIILVPESTLMFCHFISKILAFSLSIKVEGKRLAISIDPPEVLGRLRASPKLRRYAAGALAYCATWNRRCLRRIPKLRGNARVLWQQLLMGMELFVIAHEYAHHICQHGLADFASVEGAAGDLMKAQELQADWHGALITAHIGADKRLQFAHNGTAAVIALVGTDMLRRTRSILENGTAEEFESNTHPSLELRLLNLKRLRYDPNEAEAIWSAQQNCRDIMEGIWSLIEPELQQMRAHGFRPISIGTHDAQWLPFSGAKVTEERFRARA